MGQLENLRTFALVVDSKSISRAAETMNVAKSAVSRRINQLEDRYGARLIDREPGVWEVTTTGQELYQRAVRLVAEMDEIESDFKEESLSLEGPLTVSVPSDFGSTFLAPKLAAFAKAYPDIKLSVDFDDRKVDLARENYDFALRIGSEIEDGHIAQKIGASSLVICASPTYLSKFGTPTSLNELSKHSLLHFGTGKRAVWRFTVAGKPKEFEFQPALNSNSGAFLVEAMKQGVGISIAPDFLCQSAIDAGELKQLDVGASTPQLGIFLIHAENRRMNKRMRLFAQTMQVDCCG